MPTGIDEGMKNAVDKIKLVKLPEPVEVLLGFDSTPLPDAIETLLYRLTIQIIQVALSAMPPL